MIASSSHCSAAVLLQNPASRRSRRVLIWPLRPDHSVSSSVHFARQPRGAHQIWQFAELFSASQTDMNHTELPLELELL